MQAANDRKTGVPVLDISEKCTIGSLVIMAAMCGAAIWTNNLLPMAIVTVSVMTAFGIQLGERIRLRKMIQEMEATPPWMHPADASNAARKSESC